MTISMSVFTPWADISQRDIFIPPACSTQCDFKAMSIPVDSNTCPPKCWCQDTEYGGSFPIPGHTTVRREVIHLDIRCSKASPWMSEPKSFLLVWNGCACRCPQHWCRQEKLEAQRVSPNVLLHQPCQWFLLLRVWALIQILHTEDCMILSPLKLAPIPFLHHQEGTAKHIWDLSCCRRTFKCSLMYFVCVLFEN